MIKININRIYLNKELRERFNNYTKLEEAIFKLGTATPKDKLTHTESNTVLVCELEKVRQAEKQIITKEICKNSYLQGWSFWYLSTARQLRQRYTVFIALPLILFAGGLFILSYLQIESKTYIKAKFKNDG
mgnify:CR=1 FL=1